MKKRCIVFCVLLITALLLAPVSYALELNISAQSLNSLYQLYAELESQILLNKLPEPTLYESDFSYDALERTPSQFSGDAITFRGKVTQVVEGSTVSLYLVALDGKSGQTFYVLYSRPENTSRILVDDQVVIYAKYTELTTYTSTSDVSITIPSCRADLIIRPIKTSAIARATSKELEDTLASVASRIDVLNAGKEGNYQINSKNYEDYSRNADRHSAKRIAFSGKVIQTIESGALHTLRIAVDGNSDLMMYTIYSPDDNAIRILEDDQVNVSAVFSGLHTYSSTRGGEITIPSCVASDITPTNYMAPKEMAKDSDGNNIITEKTYEEFARRPATYDNAKVCFNGNVVQVIEGSGSSQYRIAVDDNYDCIILVSLSAAAKTLRVLEDDDVTVYGRLDGLLTYESTMGVPITILSCTASSIDVKGYTAPESSDKDEQGYHGITKKNYQEYARNADGHQYEAITFSADVVQVLEGDGYTQFRLAVDGDYDCMFFAQLDHDDRTTRLLEDDEVTVNGIYTGLMSYKSTLGGTITVPSCIISTYTLKGYSPAGNVSQDADGYYLVTKDNYDNYARTPDTYLLESIRLTGEVVQVVERATGNNVYRIAVDGDYDCMFYVEYAPAAGQPRILEDDFVLMTGLYYGLYSYSSTLGGKITVPASIASDISKSYVPLKEGDNNDDVFRMKERLQSLGYFTAGATLSKSYNSTCTERVKQFQKANGLPQTGVADVQTLIVLFSDQAKPNP